MTPAKPRTEHLTFVFSPAADWSPTSTRPRDCVYALHQDPFGAMSYVSGPLGTTPAVAFTLMVAGTSRAMPGGQVRPCAVTG